MKLLKNNFLLIILILITGCSHTAHRQEIQAPKLSKEVSNAIGLCSAGYASADAGILSAQLISSGVNIKGELSKVEKGTLDLSKPEMYKQYLKCLQTFLRSNQVRDITKNTSTSQINTTYNLTGSWDFQVSANASVNKNGRKQNNSSKSEIRINLSENNGIINGKYVWGTNNACPLAYINGNTNGNSVAFVVTYTGKCCGGAKMKFKGVLNSEKSLIGSFEPLGLPPASNCNIWWAEVVASKKA